MNWRTDKPTADVIVVNHTDSDIYDILRRIDGKYYLYTMFGAKEIPIDEIKKWADLEEDETVTDCNQYSTVEEELDAFIKSGKAIKEENCGFYTTTYFDRLKVARHFAKWGAEHRDRFLNWIRDLIKKGIEKPEEALNILKRIDALINDDSLWGEHLEK